MQYMKRGNAAAERDAWDEAFSFYEQGYELDTSSFDFAVKYADAARHIKNYNLARQLYQKIARKIEKNP